MNHNPQNPKWFNRDRFVLSAGHGSMLLYSLLHLSKYDVSLQDLKEFRQWGSKTPGHPEFGHTPGVEATTGPLGQGISMAVGMAMAERHLAAKYNRDNYDVVNHFTYSICGDGDLMEGVAYEACSLAGTLKLDNLIILYDSNDISLDGPTSKTFNENVRARFEAMGWSTFFVKDGNKSETATHTISIEAPMGKIEADDNFDLGYIADEEPDPDMGRIDESDLYFDSDFDNAFTNEDLPDEEIGKAPEDDSDFDNEFNVDYEYEEAPSTADSNYYRGPQKNQKTFSDIIENKKVVLMQKQRSTSLSFQNNYSVVHDIISKSLLASLSLVEEPNKLLTNANDDSDKEEKIS